MTDQEKTLRTVLIEAARDEMASSPIVDGHAYCSNFQSELHEEAVRLLRERAIQPKSTQRWSHLLSSSYVSVTFEWYEIEIFEDRANLQLCPVLYEQFVVGDFASLDHLKRAVLRLLEALLDYDRPPFERAIRTAIERRIGSSINIYNFAASLNKYNNHLRPGLFAFERLNDAQMQKINWQEVATELARETNAAVLLSAIISRRVLLMICASRPSYFTFRI